MAESRNGSKTYSRRYRPRTPYKVRLDDGQVRFLSSDQFEELFGLEWEPALAEPAARAVAVAKVLGVPPEALDGDPDRAAVASNEAVDEGLLDFESAPTVIGVEPWAWPVEWGLGERSAPDPWAGSATVKMENLTRQILKGSEATVMGGTVVARWSPKWAASAMKIPVSEVEARAAALEADGVLEPMEADDDTRTDALWADTRLSRGSLSALRDALEGRGAAGRAARAVSVARFAPGVVAPITTECMGLRLSLRPTSWPVPEESDAGRAMDYILREAPVRLLSGKVCVAATADILAKALFNGSGKAARAALDALADAGALGPVDVDGQEAPGRLRELYPGLAVRAVELEAIAEAVISGWGYDPAEDPSAPVAETMEETPVDVWSNDPKETPGPVSEARLESEGDKSPEAALERVWDDVPDEQDVRAAEVPWMKVPNGQLTIDLEGALENTPVEPSAPEPSAFQEVPAESPEDPEVMVFDARRTFVGTMGASEAREAFGEGCRIAGSVCHLLPVPEAPTGAERSSDPDWALAKGQALSLVEARNRVAVEAVLDRILAGDLDLAEAVMGAVREDPRDFRSSTAVPEILSTPLSAKRFVSRVCHEAPYVTLAVAALETLVAKGALEAPQTAKGADDDIEGLCLAWARDNVGAKNVFRKHAAQKILDGKWSLLLFEEEAAQAAKATGVPAEHAPWDMTVVAMAEEGPTFAVAVINTAGSDPITVAMGLLEKDKNAEAMALFMCGLVCSTGRRSSEESVGDAGGTTIGIGGNPEAPVGFIVVSPKSFSRAPRGPLGHPRKSPRAHTVRGHWRNQACGPAHSETRRIWISTFSKGENYGFSKGARVADRHRVWHVVLDDHALSVVA